MKNSNQSAFPEVKTDPAWNDEIYSNTYSVGGLTKREYFAAMAMQGMISGITKFKDDMTNIIVNRPKDIAELSVLYADTILDELDKIKTQSSL